MDLQIKDSLFVVTGASSGFGKAIATALSCEDATVIAVARDPEKLEALKEESPDIESISLDITRPESVDMLLRQIGPRALSGIVLNAGGPPAKAFLETGLDDWDTAYSNILRWKVALTHAILPLFRKNNYGRYLYIESMSTKQPLPNLVLSTSMRLAVTGFVKTFSSEVGKFGITANIIGPGYHMTPALERVIRKISEQKKRSPEEARKDLVRDVPVGRLGNTADFASLAVWLLSPFSSYITGQTISVDGGAVMGIMG